MLPSLSDSGDETFGLLRSLPPEDGARIMRAVLEASREGLLLVDRAGHVLLVNRRFCTLWGLPESLVVANDAAALYAFVLSQLADDEVGNGKLEAMRRLRDEGREQLGLRDGRSFELYTRRIVFGSGVARLWSVSDISQRVLVEAALRRNEQGLRQAQRVGKVGSWVLDLETDALEWSDETRRMFGVPDAEPMSVARFRDMVHPDDRGRLASAWQAACESGHYEIEHRILTRSGEIEWVLERAEFQPHADGRRRHVVGTVQNITERRRVEAELRQHRYHLEDLVQSRTAELEQANARLRDNDLRLQAMFDLSQRAQDLDATTLLGHALTLMLSLSSSTRGALWVVNQVSGSVERIALEHPLPAGRKPWREGATPIAKAGEWMEMIASAQPRLVPSLTDASRFKAIGVPVVESGAVRLLVAVSGREGGYERRATSALRQMADDVWRIVRRRQAEIELVEARCAAEAANRAKTAFLANMGHEIRTPMNAIVGLAHLLAQEVTSVRGRGYVDKITAATTQLLEIINDILDLSRMESGSMVLANAPFSPADLLSRARDRHIAAAREKGLAVTVDVDQAVPEMLVGDAARLGQILAHLVSNAVKFSARGTIGLSMRCMSQEAARVRVRFAVRDEGIGIDPAQQARLFDTFSQVDDAADRRYGGAGLGLAIAQRLARLMDASLTVDSAPGRGSEFALELSMPRVPRLHSVASGGTPTERGIAAREREQDAVAGVHDERCGEASAEETVDGETCAKALARLGALLATDDTRANDLLHEAWPCVRHQLGEAAFKLRNRVDRFDYEDALAILRSTKIESPGG